MTQTLPQPADETQEIGRRIREARTKKGLSQGELARLVGVRDQTVWKYEAGRLRPSADSLVNLAAALDVEESWIMRGEDPPKAATA